MPTGTPQPQEETPTDAPSDSPSPGTDPATVTAGVSVSGRAVRVLAADRGPAIGVPDAVMGLTGRPEVHPAGFVAYGGLYRTREDELAYAAWSGPVSEPALIVAEESAIEGLTPTVRFRLAQQLRVASNGSGAMIAQLEGARETTAVLEWTAEGLRILAESDSMVDATRSAHRVESFQALSSSVAGTLFAARNDDFSITLWSNGNGELEPVIGNEASGIAAPPRIGDCRVIVADASRTDATSGPVLLDSGAIVFQALLEDLPDRSGCAEADAVLRHERESLVTIVAQNDPVPNAPDWRFGQILLQQVLPDGEAVVRARLDKPSVGQAWSFWLFPPDGEPRLIALDQEEIELESGVSTLSNIDEQRLELTGAEHVALEVNFSDARRGVAVFGGAAHPGQPHAALEAPGASALDLLVDTETDLPAPFRDANYFGVIDRAAIDTAGQVSFYGSVSDASIDERVEDGVWQVSAGGGLTRLLAESDVVEVGTERVEAMSLVSGPYGRVPDVFEIETLNDGGLIIYGQSDGPFAERHAIIHLAP